MRYIGVAAREHSLAPTPTFLFGAMPDYLTESMFGATDLEPVGWASFNRALPPRWKITQLCSGYTEPHAVRYDFPIKPEDFRRAQRCLELEMETAIALKGRSSFL